MNKQKTNNVDHWLYMICWFWKEPGWLWKEPFVWKLGWAQLLVVLAFAVCLELVVDRLFCIFCFFFLVVPNRIIFSSIESIVDATGLERSREQRANVLKSTCLKWLTSETIEQIPNLALTKWGKRDYKSFDKIVMAAIKYSENDKGKITNLLRPSRPSCVQKPAFSWDIPYSRAISRLLFTASASATIFNLKFRS